MDGKKILASIVYAVIAPDLMSQFTMTGKSGNKSITKEKFKKYVNIINVLWRVANAADDSYTKARFEHDLTYKIMKYAYRLGLVLISY